MASAAAPGSWQAALTFRTVAGLETVAVPSEEDAFGLAAKVTAVLETEFTAKSELEAFGSV